MDFICGRDDKLRIRVQQKEIPPQFRKRNYQEDENFRQDFQLWVSALWQEKDLLMDQLHQ